VTTYAPNFTPRYKVGYVAGGITHTIQVRGARGDTFSATEGKRLYVAQIFNALAAGLYSDFAWTDASVALTDDDVFAPAAVPATTPTGAVDPGTVSAYQRIHGLTFTGRAPGSKARFTMYGVLLGMITEGDEGGNGVISSDEIAGIGTIAAIATDQFKADSGANAIFPLRATYKVNDHLLKLVRKGTIS